MKRQYDLAENLKNALFEEMQKGTKVEFRINHTFLEEETYMYGQIRVRGEVLRVEMWNPILENFYEEHGLEPVYKIPKSVLEACLEFYGTQNILIA